MAAGWPILARNGHETSTKMNAALTQAACMELPAMLRFAATSMPRKTAGKGNRRDNTSGTRPGTGSPCIRSTSSGRTWRQ
eukprot:9935571-Lingulodinium_polyedra.AAC.1